MAMADVKDTETAQAVEILASVDVAVRVGSGVGPFDDRASASEITGFTIFQKSRVDEVAETVDGLAGDPARIVGGDLRLADEVQNGLRVF
jgi:hypothetical protein